ncbi:MAG: NAD(+) synthase [Syntrophomonadaceae bacterium]|nr:NAD(+) synthase [Syntrophomonadaceae bacterium]MDD3889508.1 NAD(+) synthase [Syntrophomonadaceae bacterium]MDD4548665.1 NAD(+) synthase [Syntrophomonadaceae bacterium]
MNCETVVQYLTDWLRQRVTEAGASGVVLGVSGGIDSAVAAVIAKKAFPDNCMALYLPCESHITDMMHSRLLVEKFNIPFQVVELDNAFHILAAQFQSYLKLDGKKGKLLLANIKPRLRMIALYYSAQARNNLVIGTSNRSEINTGYSTKHGDIGVDLQLLGDLLKKEVYELAHYLQVPEIIIDKPPSGGLWPGQTDEDEMGITYQDLDGYLSDNEIDPAASIKIENMIKRSEHKRKIPPIALIPDQLK